MRGSLRRDDSLQLAGAEPFRVLGGPPGERVAHERGRGRAAWLEAHPEADEAAAQKRAPVLSQQLPGVEDDPEVDLRLRTLELESLLDADEDLADPEQPNDGDDEVEAAHQGSHAKSKAELSGDDVEPHG